MLVFTIRQLYSKSYIKFIDKFISSSQRRAAPLLELVIDKKLIGASDLIHEDEELDFSDIKIALEGCRIMCLRNKENQFNKEDPEISSILEKISKWFEENSA